MPTSPSPVAGHPDLPKSAPPISSTTPRPYDLGVGELAHREFQSALVTLSDEFLDHAERAAGALLDAHQHAPAPQDSDVARSRGEYAIELLTCGILRREYGAMAAHTSSATVDRLSDLWRLRSQDRTQKASADAERGAIFRELLLTPLAPDAPWAGDEQLVEWLAATGEFVEEARRLRTWLEPLTTGESRQHFEQITDALATWFVPLAETRLGLWTAGVDAFRAHVLADLEPREDLLLITRGSALYHLNMVGSEVMNRGFRPGYSARPDKIVLVPGCMRARSDSDCKARRVGLDISCTHCHHDCEVSALDHLAQEHGFRVFVVPHASSFTAWLRHWQGDASTALVAAACPLHLVPGGYEMRSLGLQAQCVLLDYSGCRRHWDPAGVPTRLDRARLLSLVRR